MIVSVHNLHLSYGLKKVLDNVSFSFTEESKIGIIGLNGQGKSSLLKVIAEIEVPDSGFITKPQDIKIAYLPQIPNFSEHITIDEYIKKVCRENKALKDFEIIGLLNKFSLKDHNLFIDELSGGMQKCLSMAVSFLCNCDCLLLDEPTNHLDNEMILWLEKYLIRYKGSILMVTHDRYFLERITNVMYELDRGKITVYKGNYQDYLEQKALNLELEKNRLHKLRQLYKQELEWMRKGVEARRTKKKDRIERFQALASMNLKETDEKLDLINMKSYLGKQTIEFKNVTYGYNNRILASECSFYLNRFDRLCLVGDNGCGKSTLFNLILNNLKPLSGEIIIGPTVKIGYFKQVIPKADENMLVIDYIKEVAPTLKTVNGYITASELLERFLFDSNAQYSKINTLSGGERRRLELLRVLMSAPNVLLLDEPTNDLDIYTLEILENFLDEFAGACIIISHDRYFIDKVNTRIMYFKDQKIVESILDIHQVLELINQKNEVKEVKNTFKKEVKKIKLSYFEKQEWDNIEEELEDLTNKIAQIDENIALNSSNYVKVMELHDEKMKLDKLLEAKLERYEYLEYIVKQGG